MGPHWFQFFIKNLNHLVLNEASIHSIHTVGWLLAYSLFILHCDSDQDGLELGKADTNLVGVKLNSQ